MAEYDMIDYRLVSYNKVCDAVWVSSLWGHSLRVYGIKLVQCNAVSSLSVQGFIRGILGPWLGHRLSSCLFSVFFW